MNNVPDTRVFEVEDRRLSEETEERALLHQHRWWDEQWLEREKTLYQTYLSRERQWFKEQHDHYTNWVELKRVFDQQLTDIENRTKTFVDKEQLLLKLCKEKQHTVIEVIPRTRRYGEKKLQDSHVELGRPVNAPQPGCSYNGLPCGNNPSVTPVVMPPLNTAEAEGTQRENQWRGHSDLLVQRERWWTAKWQSRESFWEQTYQRRERQWLEARHINQRRIEEETSRQNQRLRDFANLARKFKSREEILVKLLKDDRQHLLVPIEKIVPETLSTQESGEEPVEDRRPPAQPQVHNSDAIVLQRERWWSEQWQKREKILQQTFKDEEQQWLQVQSKNQKRYEELRCRYEQQLRDFEIFSQESQMREQLLMKLCKQDKHHTVVELSPETSPTQVSAEGGVQDTRCELGRLLQQVSEVKETHDTVKPSAEFLLQLLDASAAEKKQNNQWTQEEEVLLQRERWWLVQWQERERRWQQAFNDRKRQWLENHFENQRSYEELKCLHEQQLQDFDIFAQKSEKNEQLLLTLLNSDRHHLVVEIRKTHPETKHSQTSGEERTQDKTHTAFHTEPGVINPTELKEKAKDADVEQHNCINPKAHPTAPHPKASNTSPQSVNNTKTNRKKNKKRRH